MTTDDTNRGLATDDDDDDDDDGLDLCVLVFWWFGGPREDGCGMDV